jgi:hypothetical protein
MARDFKLSNFTFTTAATPTGTVLGITATSPAGDLANTGATIGLNAAASNTSVGVNGDTKQVMGFRNSKIQPIDATASVTALQTQLASIAAGNEISAITNDPVLPGNTSYAEMFMTFNLSWTLNATAGSNLLENGGYFVVEGAYDNGFGAVDASSYAPISGAVPLVIPSANLAAVAVAGNAVTTVNAHNLKPGDLVVFYVVTGFSTAPTAKQQYQVLTVPAANQFTIAVTGGTTAVTLAGTPTAGIAVYRCLGGALGGHRAAAQIVPTRRPYMRLAFRYATAATAAAATLNLSRVGLTLGRDNASTY